MKVFERYIESRQNGAMFTAHVGGVIWVPGRKHDVANVACCTDPYVLHSLLYKATV
jgi:hypothetical protein